MGDLHGCCAELDALLAKIEYAPGRDRLLLTGDAFTRGPDPFGVWQRIRGSGAEMVMGNHDDVLRGQLREVAAGRDPKSAYSDRNATTLPALAPYADELTAWLAALPLYIEEPGFLLVHAGIDPERGLGGTTRDQFLTIRTWPPERGVTTRWHEHLDQRHVIPGRPIVYGHDAPQGLLVKRFPEAGNGARPGLVALDSGCVFGNALSAYVLEEDRIVQVPAQRRWIKSGSFSYIRRRYRPERPSAGGRDQS